MKKLLITMMICVIAGFSTYAQNGDLMAATHNIYSGLEHTYRVTGSDAFLWEVFSDENCTSPVVAGVNTYTFSAGTDATKDLTITWNEPLASPATYYLRVRQTDGNGCINYKTLRVVVTSVSSMNFAFDQPTSSDCAVNISVSDVSIDVLLTGAYLVHETGKQARIEYSIGAAGAKNWLDVDLGSGTGEGAYTITIPAADLLSADAEVAESFDIYVHQLEDGNGALRVFGTPRTHEWTATALPTVDDIQF